MGGFSGQVPSTPLPTFVADVRQGRVVNVLVPVAPLTRNPDMRWVLAHCRAQTGTAATVRDEGATYRRYVCGPASGP